MIKQLLIASVGCFFFWIAADIHRDEDSKIKLFSKYWVIQLVLIVIGTLIIMNIKK